MIDTLPSDISLACSVSVQVKMQVAVGLLVISLCMGAQVNFSLSLDDINHSEKGLNNENVTAVNETTAESNSTVQDGNFRLNPNVIPFHYVIRMIHNLTSKDMGNLTAPGKVWISISVTEATDNITLHADDLVIEKVEVIGTKFWKELLYY